MQRILQMAALAVLVLGPLTAAASETRIRVENSGGDGSVKVVLVDVSVTSVEMSVPGVASGEVLTVEAPVRRVALHGGAIEPDRLLEAEVARKVRAASRQAPTVIVIGAKKRTRYETPRFVSPAFTSADFAFAPIYGAPVQRPVRHHSRTHAMRPQQPRRVVRTSSRSRGSFSSRGMMPRR